MDDSPVYQSTDEIPFNLSHYAERHDGEPHHAEKGDWKLLPPRTFGRRPWLYVNMTLAQAKREAKEKIGDRPVKRGEEFVLVP